MNPFYRRLLTFGQMVQQLSKVNDTDYTNLFEVEHPGYPVFIGPVNIKPRLSFNTPCPKKHRNQITRIFDVCFGSSPELVNS